jgi:hypothetical protein
MQWDLGIQGIAYLAGMAAGFGVVAGLLVGGGMAGRVRAALIATVACFVTGLATSEMLFGSATEEELQPNIDGLSRDEALLSSLLTTVVVVLAVRYVSRRHLTKAGKHLTSGHHGRHARHV